MAAMEMRWPPTRLIETLRQLRELEMVHRLLSELIEGNTGPPPVTDADLSALRTRTMSEFDADDKTCSICFEDMLVGVTVCDLPCGHVFCDPCVRPWLLLHRTCPVCRAEVASPQTREAEAAKRRGADAEAESEGAGLRHPMLVLRGEDGGRPTPVLVNRGTDVMDESVRRRSPESRRGERPPLQLPRVVDDEEARWSPRPQPQPQPQPQTVAVANDFGQRHDLFIASPGRGGEHQFHQGSPVFTVRDRRRRLATSLPSNSNVSTVDGDIDGRWNRRHPRHHPRQHSQPPPRPAPSSLPARLRNQIRESYPEALTADAPGSALVPAPPPTAPRDSTARPLTLWDGPRRVSRRHLDA